MIEDGSCFSIDDRFAVCVSCSDVRLEFNDGFLVEEFCKIKKKFNVSLFYKSIYV